MKRYIYVILVLMFSCTVVSAANYLYHANEVSFTSNNKNWNVDNVKDALDDLYSKIDSGEHDKLTLYNAIKHSGLVTEDMTYNEMLNALSTYFPSQLYLFNTTNGYNVSKFGTIAGPAYSGNLVSRSGDKSIEPASLSFTINALGGTGANGAGPYIGTYSFTTDKYVDLTNYKKMILDGKTIYDGYHNVNKTYRNAWIDLIDKNGTSKTVFTAGGGNGSTGVTFTNKEVMLTEYSGEYKIRFNIRANAYDSGWCYTKLIITSMTFE